MTLAEGIDTRREARPTASRRNAKLRLVVSAGAVATFVIAATIGPELTGYDPVATDPAARLQPPGSRLDDGQIAWLGTDELGRGILAQLLEGARISLLVALTTIAIGCAIGVVLGMVSGYFGGWIDSVIMRLGDIQLSFPSILLAILISGVLGRSVLNVVITLAVTRWVLFARVARASTLSVKERQYVDSARVLGASRIRILTRYILPSAVGPLLVIATAQVGLMIIAEASLSFLGLGVPLTQPSWGAMIAGGRDYLGTAWWIATLPGIAVVLTVVSVGLLSDRLRGVLDPQART